MALTNQEFFDKTITHLVKQGCRAWGELGGAPGDGSGCLYRTEEGLSCAAGVHMPDSEYRREMEGCNIHSLVVKWPSTAQYFPSVPLTSILQRLHDDGSNWSSTDGFVGWAEAERIANTYGLTFDKSTYQKAGE